MRVLDSVRALAASLPCRQIFGEDGTLYLSRYKLHGWMPDNRGEFPCSVYLHNIHRADLDEALHSHPWEWAQTMVLTGGYCQSVGYLLPDGGLASGGEITLCAGAGFRMESNFVHRIASVLPDTWTLFMVGEKTASWGFYVEGRGLVPWRERLAERGLEPAY